MRLFLLILSIVAIATVAANAGSVRAQTKFDSYGRLITDDEAAHLDLFHEELRNHPNLRGFLIGYDDPSVPRGVFLRRLYGDQTYLVELRGLEPNRLSVIDGGCREKLTFEMWLAPLNGKPPSGGLESTCPPAPTKPVLFDRECLACDPVVFLDLPGLGVGLKFYAASLLSAPGSRALITVRPGHEKSSSGALADARRAKRKLTREFGVPSERITIRLVGRRKDSLPTAEMWIIPRGAL